MRKIIHSTNNKRKKNTNQIIGDDIGSRFNQDNAPISDNVSIFKSCSIRFFYFFFGVCVTAFSLTRYFNFSNVVPHKVVHQPENEKETALPSISHQTTVEKKYEAEKISGPNIEYYWQYFSDYRKQCKAGGLCGVVLLMHGCGYHVLILFVLRFLVPVNLQHHTVDVL